MRHRLACSSSDIHRALQCSLMAAPLGKKRRKGRKLNSPEWRKKAVRMDFRMRIGLGKHVAERKNEVVQVPMIVELASIVIKRGIRAPRISVQNPAHPLNFALRVCSSRAALTKRSCRRVRSHRRVRHDCGTKISHVMHGAIVSQLVDSG